MRTKFVALISNPFQTCTSALMKTYVSMIKRRKHIIVNEMVRFSYLHPCVNDNREKADRENVEELEKLKQPHGLDGIIS